MGASSRTPAQFRDAVRTSFGAHWTAAGEDREIGNRIRGALALLPEGRDGGMHQTRIPGGEGFGVETERCKAAHRLTLEKHIRRRHQLRKESAPLLGIEV